MGGPKPSPVDKNRSTTGGQSGPSYLLQWPQREDSPDHANWERCVSFGGEFTSEFYILIRCKLYTIYRNMPIKGASSNKGTPCLEEPNAIMSGQNWQCFFNNCPIFNLKPPLESWEPQLSPQSIRFGLARAPVALIRHSIVGIFPSWLLELNRQTDTTKPKIWLLCCL